MHACLQVAKSHQMLLQDAAKSDKTLAEHCLHVSDLKWNSGVGLLFPWLEVCSAHCLTTD